MLETEYRKKQQIIREKRSWLVTLTLGLFAILSWTGVVALLKYIEHDRYIILSALIPLVLLSIMLTLGALKGTKQVAKDVVEVILYLAFWRP